VDCPGVLFGGGQDAFLPLRRFCRSVCRASHTVRIIPRVRLKWLEPSAVSIANGRCSASNIGALGGSDMTVSYIPRSERKPLDRLNIARRLYQALVAQDSDRLITLRDGEGKVVARHDLRPEQDDPEIAS
jgi:hypothetical protein